MIFDKVTPEFKAEFDNLVSEANSILITSHKGGDDDSIGCVLSTYYILKEQYPDKKIEIIYSQEVNQRWSYFKNFDQIKSVDDVANIVNNYDLTLYLDASEYYRFSDLGEKLKTETRKSICIDHHKNNPDNFDLTLLDSNASSCSELIYFLLVQDLKKVPTTLAECLLLGIIGDTGNMEFIRPSQAYIFPIVQRLVTDGEIDIQALKDKYSTYSYREFEIFREFAKNLVIKNIENWPSFVISYINRDFINKGKYTQIELGAGSNIAIQAFGKSLTEAAWVVFIKPRKDGSVNFSLRSRPGSVNVRKLMEDMNIGGGHDRSAGGSFKDNNLETDPLKALEKLFTWMETHKPEIN